jgi:hypothetical protein
MPLRDHFRPPLFPRRSWEDFHAGWTVMLRTDLNRHLPTGFFAEAQTHLGPIVEMDACRDARLG